MLDFDAARGEVEVEAGIQWPALVEYLHARRPGGPAPVGHHPEADRRRPPHASAGRSAANVHGRGLALRPIVADVESFTLVGADGERPPLHPRRTRELFRLAIGGYGLFGVVAAVRLRLAPRRKVRREVEVIAVDDSSPAFERRIAEGCLYGDFQFAIDDRGDDFLRPASAPCYRPVADEHADPAGRPALSRARLGRRSSTWRTSTSAAPSTPTAPTTWRPTARSTGPTPTS